MMASHAGGLLFLCRREPRRTLWGTFALGQEPYEEPPRRLAEAAEARGLNPDVVRVLKPGETIAW